MRLLTQNLLMCNVKACAETARREDGKLASYPLKVVPEEGGLAKEESEFNVETVAGMLERIDWDALRETASDLGVAELPETIPEGAKEDEAFLRSVHELVFEVHILEGSLVCPHCGRVYPITKGVPNMLLNEDEV